MTPDSREKEATTLPAADRQPTVAPGEVLTDFRVIRLDAPIPAAVSLEPEGAAPRRAVPLAPPTAKELAAAREIALAAARPRLAAKAAAARARRPRIESKLAGATNSEEMLRVMDVEVALYRARRLSGADDKQRELFRVLSVLMFIGLVIAVIGAMWYLQTLKDGHARIGGQRPAAAAGR